MNSTGFNGGDPKSVKKTVKLSIFFTLLESTRVKAARQTLVKLTPVNAFSYNYNRKFYNMRQRQLAELSLSLSYEYCGSSSHTYQS